jgi:hypothetical protein
MTQLTNTTKIQLVDFIQNRKGKFQAIVKTQSKMLIAYDLDDRYNETDILNNWKKGALQTLQFKPKGSTSWLTVFARSGNKIIVIDNQIAKNIKVGTVNQLFFNTNLYDQHQYQAVNATNWDSYVFTKNK